MTNLLRKIRKNILINSKLSKYLVYAFGEIALIAVGIGIALSANNYSEEQKALQQSNFFLSGMLEDLASDTLRLDKMTRQIDNQLNIEQWLLDKTEFKISDIDSIKKAASSIKWTFYINNRSFQNIQNTNDFKLFGHDALYSRISKYYLITADRITQNNQLEANKSVTTNAFEKLINENLYINTREYQDYSGFGVKINSENKIDSSENYSEVLNNLNNIPIKNTLNEKFARHNYLSLTLTFCNYEAKSLIKEINKALK